MSIDYLGFGRQCRIAGSCGRFALRHALLCLGVPTDEESLTDALGVGRVRGILGLEESRLIQAIAAYECQAAEVAASTGKQAKRTLDDLLLRGIPCIVSVENGSHWAVVTGRQGSRYWWVDSASSVLFGQSSWADLASRMWLEPPDEPYYLIGVLPRRRAWLQQSLVHRFGSVATELRDGELRIAWGKRLAVLNDVFDGQPGRGLAAHEVLRALDCSMPASRKHREMSVVAREHQLRVPKKHAGRALATIAESLGC